MPERNSSIDQIVGSLPDEDKENLLQQFATKFETQSPRNEQFEGLLEFEIDISPEQSQIIDLENTITNQLCQHFGIATIDITPDKFHVIDSAHWPRNYNEAGVHFPLDQSIYMQEPSSLLKFAAVSLHEMIHFKSYNSIQADNQETMKEFRSGLSMNSRSGGQRFLNNLNEGIIEDATKVVMQRVIMKDPVFAEEIKQTEQTKQNYAHLKDANGQPALESSEIYRVNIVPTSDGGFDSYTERFTYNNQRLAYINLLGKLAEKNKEGIERQEIGLMFLRAVMQGNMLPVAKLIDHTFGQGTFRRIATLDENLDELLKFIESL